MLVYDNWGTSQTWSALAMVIRIGHFGSFGSCEYALCQVCIEIVIVVSYCITTDKGQFKVWIIKMYCDIIEPRGLLY